MSAWSNSNTTSSRELRLFSLFAIVGLVATNVGGADAFVAIRETKNNIADRYEGRNCKNWCKSSTTTTTTTNNHSIGSCFSDSSTTQKRTGNGRCQNFPLRGAVNPNVGYEYIPPNPDANPGSFHMPGLRSSYPQGTPAGLRGEAVRSAMVTTERCIGWNLSTNEETSMGGLLQISGRGTLDFLNGKLTRDFRSNNNNNKPGTSSYTEACLLDAKGRLIDVLRVTLDESNRRALILTSPGHSSDDLLQRLDPFVFPMDEVDLTNFCSDNTGNENEDSSSSDNSFAFTLVSTQYKHVRKVLQEQTNLSLEKDEMVFPSMAQGVVWKPRSNDNDDDVQILVVPSTGISSAACVGYTFVFFGSGLSAATLGKQTWEHLIGEENPEGPIEVGALEYETLRVESGQPAYGQEYGIDLSLKEKKEREQMTENATGGEDGKRNATKKRKKKSIDLIKTSPFELHFDPLIDLDKGCYLGQEGIAFALRNSRGAPRTLYTVVFEDDFNTYESQSRGDRSDLDNLTTLPKPGQKLFALGSNEKLEVGRLTSMGEAGGTGSRFTVGLAMVKRADSIRKKMKTLDLEIPRNADDFLDVDFASGSGIIQPPPMDPLEGLEIIVEGTFTMGVLKGIPTRQSGMRRNSNMYDPDIEVEGIEEFESTTMSPSLASTMPSTSTPVAEPEVNYESVDGADDDILANLEQMEAEVAEATAEAEVATAEAKRKSEKMELLKKRAEEAMARRKEKADVDAEAKRKTEKMEQLKKRAEEAMARRKEKAKAVQTEEIDPAVDEARRKAEKMAMLKKRADEAMARRKAKKE